MVDAHEQQPIETSPHEMSLEQMTNANREKLTSLWQEGLVTGVTLGENRNFGGIIFRGDPGKFEKTGILYYISPDGSYVAEINTDKKEDINVPTDSHEFNIIDQEDNKPETIAHVLHGMTGGNFQDSSGPNYHQKDINTPTPKIENAYSRLKTIVEEKRQPSQNTQATIKTSYSHLKDL